MVTKIRLIIPSLLNRVYYSTPAGICGCEQRTIQQSLTIVLTSMITGRLTDSPYDTTRRHTFTAAKLTLWSTTKYLLSDLVSIGKSQLITQRITSYRWVWRRSSWKRRWTTCCVKLRRHYDDKKESTNWTSRRTSSVQAKHCHTRLHTYTRPPHNNHFQYSV